MRAPNRNIALFSNAPVLRKSITERRDGRALVPAKVSATMSSQNSQYTCVDCNEAELYTFAFPLWRYHFALVLLILGVAVFTIGMALFYARAQVTYSLWLRQPFGLLLITIGMLITCVTPLRDFIGEENTPCWLARSNLYWVVACLPAGIVTRVLAIYKLRLRQQAVSAALAKKMAQSHQRLVRRRTSEADVSKPAPLKVDPVPLEEHLDSVQAPLGQSRRLTTSDTVTGDGMLENVHALPVSAFRRALLYVCTCGNAIGGRARRSTAVAGGIAAGGGVGSSSAVAGSPSTAEPSLSLALSASGALSSQGTITVTTSGSMRALILAPSSSHRSLAPKSPSREHTAASAAAVRDDLVTFLARELPLHTISGQTATFLVAQIPTALAWMIRMGIWGSRGLLSGYGGECTRVDVIDILLVALCTVPPLLLSISTSRRISRMKDPYYLRQELNLLGALFVIGLAWYGVGKIFAYWDAYGLSSDYAAYGVSLLYALAAVWGPLVASYVLPLWKPAALYVTESTASDRDLGSQITAKPASTTTSEGGGCGSGSGVFDPSKSHTPTRMHGFKEAPVTATVVQQQRQQQLPRSSAKDDTTPSGSMVLGRSIDRKPPIHSVSGDATQHGSSGHYQQAQYRAYLRACIEKEHGGHGGGEGGDLSSGGGSAVALPSSLTARDWCGMSATVIKTVATLPSISAILAQPASARLTGAQCLTVTHYLVFTRLGRACFRDALESEFALENLLFILDCERAREAAIIAEEALVALGDAEGEAEQHTALRTARAEGVGTPRKMALLQFGRSMRDMVKVLSRPVAASAARSTGAGASSARAAGVNPVTQHNSVRTRRSAVAPEPATVTAASSNGTRSAVVAPEPAAPHLTAVSFTSREPADATVAAARSDSTTRTAASAHSASEKAELPAPLTRSSSRALDDDDGGEDETVPDDEGVRVMKLRSAFEATRAVVQRRLERVYTRCE